MRLTGTAAFLRITLAVGALLALTLTGCTRFGKKPPTEKTGEQGVPVEVAPVTLGTMADTITVTGTVKATRETNITAQTSARVLDVRVREGDTVSSGQVLVTLDATEALTQQRQAQAGADGARARLEAAQRRLEITEQGARQEERAIARNRLDQAESARRTAEADYARLTELFAQGAISKQQLDAAQTSYDSAKAERDSARKSLDLTEKGARPEEIAASRKDVEAAAASLTQASAMLAEAQKRLSYTSIRSPFAGIVYSRAVDPGEVVASGGEPLLRIADPTSVYYEATVPERVALRIAAGQRVEVTVQGDGHDDIQGKVERMVPVADPASRNFLVRVALLEGASKAKPGMFARGAVVVQESRDAVIVPKDALIEREGKTLVFVVDDGKAVRREISVGVMDTERAQVLSGLQPGEMVVIVGAQGLKDGDAVQVKANGA